jgi:hypothetical protein
MLIFGGSVGFPLGPLVIIGAIYVWGLELTRVRRLYRRLNHGRKASVR